MCEPYGTKTPIEIYHMCASCRSIGLSVPLGHFNSDIEIQKAEGNVHHSKLVLANAAS